MCKIQFLQYLHWCKCGCSSLDIHKSFGLWSGYLSHDLSYLSNVTYISLLVTFLSLLLDSISHLFIWSSSAHSGARNILSALRTLSTQRVLSTQGQALWCHPRPTRQNPPAEEYCQLRGFYWCGGHYQHKEPWCQPKPARQTQQQSDSGKVGESTVWYCKCCIIA